MPGDEVTLGEVARRMERLEGRLDALEDRYRRTGWMIGLAIAAPFISSLAAAVLKGTP
jgi:hypothetical protein